MAEAAVSSVLQSLGDLLIEEAKFLHGEGGHAEQILEELRKMQGFLKDADARQTKEESVRNLVAEARKLAYDAGDVLESFVLGAASKRKGGIRNNFKRYVCFSDESIALRKVEAIKTRISELTNRLQTSGIRVLTEGEGSSSAIGSQPQLRPSSSSIGLEEDFVGLNEDVESLVAHLVKDEGRDEWHQVVSICGMGGLGKTTIARRIYNHKNVKQHFSAYAWVCISQQWQTRDVLQEILLKLTRQKEGQIQNLRVEELAVQILEIQQKERCLVALDDIWSTDAWDSLRSAFPTEERGSKLLLTSRNKDVARHIDPEGFIHEPRVLNEDESLELLQKTLFKRIDQTDPGDDKKKELAREMVKQCGGLPLAVVVFRGVLVTKQTLGEWERVKENIESLVRGKGKGQQQQPHERLLEVLALSYNDLPYHLKPCFLYLGKFLEDTDIEAERLYQLWMAENLVLSGHRRGEETMMDVAEGYLGELAHRCMVQVKLEEEEAPYRSFHSCRLHDLMRDLCLSKAKEEDFFKVIDVRRGSGHDLEEFSSSTSRNTQRLVIYFDEEDIGSRHVPLLDKEMSRHLRSLLFLTSQYHKPFSALEVSANSLLHEPFSCEERALQIVRSGLNDFKFLRALAIEGLYRFKLPKAIGNLVHLRYLSFRRTELFEFPTSIHNLEQLETLDLRCATDVSFYPLENVLRKVRRLRHLYLPPWGVRYNPLYKKTKVSLDSLSNLETLENFDLSWCDHGHFFELTNLRKLTAEVNRNNEDLERIIHYLLNINPNRLRHSSLLIICCDFGSEKGQSLLKQMLVLGCSSLHQLDIRGPIVKLPGYDDHFHFSPSLIMLTLSSSELEEDPMPTLEKFPNLRTLSFYEDSFLGKEMICSATGFPQLRNLGLYSISNLENWRLEEGAMPNLSVLEIWKSPNLEMLPDGLRSLTHLQELHFLDMPENFTNRVRVLDGVEGEDFHKVQHVPSILIHQINNSAN